jgi:hypothetical protein
LEWLDDCTEKIDPTRELFNWNRKKHPVIYWYVNKLKSWYTICLANPESINFKLQWG